MAARRETLRKFFARYGALSQAADSKRLAAMYAASFIVGGPQGSMAYPNDDKFVEWLKGVFSANQQVGMRDLKAVAVKSRALSPMHQFATVKWGVRFAKTGKRLITFEIHYLVEATAATWKILAYVSAADQQIEMKKLGLI